MQKLFPSILAGLAILSSQVTIADTQLTGAGSTFVEPIANQWFSEFHNTVNKNIQVNYQGIGSGAGIKQLMAGTVDFCRNRRPHEGEEEKTLAQGVLHAPIVIGAVALAYNIPLSKPLQLDSSALSEIYTGKIKAWNDAKIQKLNPGVALPELAITPIYRSDASGTTAVYTDYLSKVDSNFKSTVGQGKAVSWPTGMGGKGNAGIAALVNQTPGAIGYVELSYALSNKMSYASLKNAAGVFVLPHRKSCNRIFRNIFKRNAQQKF